MAEDTPNSFLSDLSFLALVEDVACLMLLLSANLTSLPWLMSIWYVCSSLNIMALFFSDLFELGLSSIILIFLVPRSRLDLFILKDTLLVWVFFFVRIHFSLGNLARFFFGCTRVCQFLMQLDQCWLNILEENYN